MEWTMGDEAVKVQLFRFIDVLPLLRSPADITRHLREYFGEAGEHLPGWLRAAACAGCRSDGLLGRLLAGAGPLQRRAPGPPLHRRLQPAGSPRRPSPSCGGGRWPSPSICSARRPSPRAEAEQLPARIPRADRRPEPARSTPGRPIDLIDRDDQRPAAARQRVGQAVVALQPVRSHRPGRHQPRPSAPGCGRSSAPPGSSGPSSTSTWSSTPTRT